MPIDEAVSNHMSQVYWEWLSAFDQDPLASPLQHPDFVLAELTAARARSDMQPAIVRVVSNNGSSHGVLLPKTIRTGQVGGLGPSWSLTGLRLAGGRFLGRDPSKFQLQESLKLAAQYAIDSGADFLLIEDVDAASPLHASITDEKSHGCRLFATHEFQPRRYIDFPETASKYWQSFSSRSLSKFRRNLKKLGQTRLERITELDQVPDFLRAAHEISRQSWQSRQFGLRIRNDEAELRQMSALAQHGLLRSYLWWIEGKPAAFAVCNQNGPCFRYEEIAYCAEYGQFSPGRTMLHQIVEDLLQYNSPETFDFGGGDAEYKQQFANRESSSGTIWLVPPTRRARWSLWYLTFCRRVRSAARSMIMKSGWGTRARQWVRSAGATPGACSNQETAVSATNAD